MHIEGSTVGAILTGSNNITGDIYINNIQNDNNNKINRERTYFLPKLEEGFLGREEEFNELKSLFLEDDLRQIAICGPPGYGKSELAKKFVVWCKDEGKINNIVWLNAKTIDDLHESLEYLAEEFNIKFDKRKYGQDIYENFVKNTIIVFDDVPDRQTVRDYEPRFNNFYCIFTCSNNSWTGIKRLKLKGLQPKFALQVLQYYLDDSYNELNACKYSDLAKLCDYCPLVLQVVGSYIKRETEALGKDFHVNNYIDELETFLNESIKNDKLCCSPILYKMSVYGAIKKSIDKVKEKSKLALNILYVCSYLNNKCISRNLLFGIKNVSRMLENCNSKNEQLFRDALIILSEYSFINVYKETIFIHSFYQKIIRHHLNKSEEQIQHEIYRACLDLIINIEYYLHIPSIIKYADESEMNQNLFINFYKSNANILNRNKYNKKHKDCTSERKGSQLILELLIEGRCENSLKNVLKHLGETQSIKYINEFNLLLITVNSGDLEILKILLNYNPNVNKEDNDGHNALHVASFKCNEKMIKLLLNKKANAYTTDNNQNTVLHNFLSGLKYNQTINTNKVKKIIDLLKGSTDISEIKNRSEESLLHEVVSSFRPELIELFINEFGIDPNVLDGQGWTPLHKLVYEAYQATRITSDEDRIIVTAQKLIDCKASLNIRSNNEDMLTPLQFAKHFKVDFLTSVLKNEGMFSYTVRNWLLKLTKY